MWRIKVIFEHVIISTRKAGPGIRMGLDWWFAIYRPSSEAVGKEKKRVTITQGPYSAAGPVDVYSLDDAAPTGVFMTRKTGLVPDSNGVILLAGDEWKPILYPYRGHDATIKPPLPEWIALIVGVRYGDPLQSGNKIIQGKRSMDESMRIYMPTEELFRVGMIAMELTTPSGWGTFSCLLSAMKPVAASPRTASRSTEKEEGTFQALSFENDRLPSCCIRTLKEMQLIMQQARANITTIKVLHLLGIFGELANPHFAAHMAAKPFAEGLATLVKLGVDEVATHTIVHDLLRLVAGQLAMVATVHSTETHECDARLHPALNDAWSKLADKLLTEAQGE